MSESLRNDGRIWLPLRPADDRSAAAIPEDERDYFLERRYPSYGNWCRVIWPPAGPGSCAWRAGAWGRAAVPSIWI